MSKREGPFQMYRGDSTRNFRDDEKNHICNPIYPSYERVE